MGETKGGERMVLELDVGALLDFLNGGLVQDLLKAGGYDQAEAERRRLVRKLKVAKRQQEISEGEDKSTGADWVPNCVSEPMFLRKLVLFLWGMYLADAVKDSGREYLIDERKELMEFCVSRLSALKKPRTNWDRVHNMTMEELADFISKLGGHTCTPSGPKCPTGECRKCWEKWFKEEINEQL